MRALLLSSVAVLLIACSPPAATSGDKAGGETQSASNAPSITGPAQMRTGRWNKVMTVMGRETHEVECITTADLNEIARQPNSQCTSTQGFQRTAEGWVREDTCTGEDGGGHLRTVVNGDLQNNYVVDLTMSGNGMPQAMQVHIVATYEGACRGDE